MFTGTNVFVSGISILGQKLKGVRNTRSETPFYFENLIKNASILFEGLPPLVIGLIV
jgi:hypothetical protein